MATPTPTTTTRQVGHYGYTVWQATWSTTDNFSASAIIDLSGLTDYTTSVGIRYACIIASSDLSVDLLFDATADQMVLSKPPGVPMAQQDFTPLPDGKLVKTASGGTGDLVLTTRNAASGLEAYLLIEWYAN